MSIWLHFLRDPWGEMLLEDERGHDDNVVGFGIQGTAEVVLSSSRTKSSSDANPILLEGIRSGQV